MKFIINIIIMLLLLAISFFIFGTGFTTFLLDSTIQGLLSFAQIFSNATAENSIEKATNFLFNLIKTIGMILLYYFLANLIRKLIVKE
jgi:hypothetical protein